MKPNPLLTAAQATPLKRADKAFLVAFCQQYQQHGTTRRWSIPSASSAAGYDTRTGQRRLAASSTLIRAGYLIRQDEKRDNGENHAPWFTITDPANWPRMPTAARAGGDRLSPVTESHQGVVTDCHPNLVTKYNPPVGSNEPTLPPAGGEVAGGSKVVCLETHRAKLEPKLDNPPAKPKRASRRKARGVDPGEAFVSSNGLRLAHVRDLYHRHCCAPVGEDESPQDLPRIARLEKRIPAFVELCAELGDKATYQWFGMWFRWARANRWTNGTAPDNGWQAGIDYLLNVQTLWTVREKKLKRHDPEGWINEPDPADDPIPAPANDHPEMRHAIG